ncbi:hypothetical protein BJ875DRAFT_440735 [Amylocarpus encephaloides]|uniref:MYB DNA-binding domain-containing protein n=1 Tax=Amylocarpus encephaloides TaxID=45428 RepID=A0A9P7YL50_9HELO|nr:hypothetical protein BJ875DRAFT_440735 [Amylocarpus encephaloides]
MDIVYSICIAHPPDSPSSSHAPDSKESSSPPPGQEQQPLQRPQQAQTQPQHPPEPYQQQPQQDQQTQQYYQQQQYQVYQQQQQQQQLLQQQQQPQSFLPPPPPPQRRHHTRSTSVPSFNPQEGAGSAYAIGQPSPGAAGKRTMPPHPSESPAKKQSKWSAEEDALIIDLRGGGMKWEDISKRLLGRSAISCRLHYQNYLERRSEWDEERKNKLARLYERFKPEMWSKVAEEMAVPWRAAEAMHWQLGETDMARRAGVVPFSLSSVTLEAAPAGRGSSPTRGHSHPHPPSQSPSHSHSHSFSGPLGSSSRFNRPAPSPSGQAASSRTIAARRESTPRSIPPPSPSEGIALAAIGQGIPMAMGRGGPMLPSVAEMTTGVSPYSSPAYAMSMGMPMSGGGQQSPGPFLPPVGGMQDRQGEGKRSRGSPGAESRETSRRRQ